MKLEANSRRVLAITKSKAKMYEFGVEEKHHIELYSDPRKLLITCIGILGELSHLEARNLGETEYRDALKEQSVQIGQYFDALNLSRLETELSDYLLLVGASSYYLADMPGSSNVLSDSLPYEIIGLSPNYLEGLLVWLLKGDLGAERFHYAECDLRLQIDTFADAFRAFFTGESEVASVEAAAENLRSATYGLGNDREYLFVDVIVAIARRKVAHSSIQCLPAYTGLPLTAWHEALAKKDFMREFWPAQRLLGLKGVLQGASAIVQMPTSAGKTKSTELIIRSSFLSGRASVAVVVAPFRALCREISASFNKSFEGEEIVLNELRDIPLLSEEENEFIKRLLGGTSFGEPAAKTILVSTPEKLVYLLRHEPELASKIGLLVLDEGHQFDTGQRGVTYELLLASLKKQVPDECQKVLISAVMSNAETIGEWLNGEAGISVSGESMLPTIRSVAFASWKTKLGQLEYFVQNEYDERSFFVPRIIEQTKLKPRPRETKSRVFPAKDSAFSIAAYFGVKLVSQGPVAVFCGDKRSVISISNQLVDYFERGLPYDPPVESCDGDEIERIFNLAVMHWGTDYTLTKSIALGVLPHSANVPNGIRVSTEWAMENARARLVVCTSTLAQGVNLPIKYLVVSSTLQGGEQISTRDFHNLIGRAGRSGYHTEGSIIFADHKIFDLKNNRRNRWRWQNAMHLLNFSNAEECLSSLLELAKPFEGDLAEIDLIEFVSNPNGVREEIEVWGIENEEDVSEELFEFRKKERLIDAVESYFLAYLKDNPEADEGVFVDLCKGTLAYSLAGDEDKETIEEIFEVIFQRVQKVEKAKHAYFGKAILGLNQLAQVEAWLTDVFEELRGSVNSSEELLRKCWPLLNSVVGSPLMQKIQPENLKVEIAERWINGASYSELYEFAAANDAIVRAKSQKRKITMEHIVEFTDNSLGYDAMLVVGAIADVMEGQALDDELVEAFRFLQSRLRYGLETLLQLWIYQKGYVDREIVKDFARCLTNEGVNPEAFGDDIWDVHSDKLGELLNKYPTYFHEVSTIQK